MSSRILVRGYEEGDEVGIVELMKPYWPHFANGNPLPNWEWEYRKCPYESIVTVAEDMRRIVGHYSVIPMAMKFKDMHLLGGKAEGSAIHPDYRKKGGDESGEGGKELFIRLIHETFDSSREKGVRLIWGFPNQKALGGQIRAGYSHLRVPISRFAFPLNLRRVPRTLLSSFRGTPSLRRTLRTLSESVPKLLSPDDQPKETDAMGTTDDVHSIEDLWKSVSEDCDCITLQRAHDYLQWRIIGNRVIPHRMLAFRRDAKVTAYVSVARRNSSEGVIVDMFALRDGVEDLRILVNHALVTLKSACDYVTTWMTRNKLTERYEQVLKSVGFLELPESELDMLVRSFGLPESYSTDPKNWFINPIFTEGIS